MGLDRYQEQLSIDTPEQVSLRLPVAGVGSRFLAVFADTAIQIAALILFWVVVALIAASAPAAPRAVQPSPRAQAWGVAILIFLHFAAYWGYFTLFEGLWRGQTPGKRLFRLRVIKDSGRQITFVESMARNLLRVIDMLPAMYLIGILSVLFTRERKRLGDLVAGTLVVHAEEVVEADSLADATRTFTAGMFSGGETAEGVAAQTAAYFPATAIARLDADDLAMLDTFFARIPELEVATKDAITARLLASLCARMQVAIPEGEGARALLDAIAYELRNQMGLLER
jgi:uncharacterized RDD family membrane protein YckC